MHYRLAQHTIIIVNLHFGVRSSCYRKINYGKNASESKLIKGVQNYYHQLFLETGQAENLANFAVRWRFGVVKAMCTVVPSHDGYIPRLSLSTCSRIN